VAPRFKGTIDTVIMNDKALVHAWVILQELPDGPLLRRKEVEAVVKELPALLTLSEYANQCEFGSAFDLSLIITTRHREGVRVLPDVSTEIRDFWN
jgi:hypothetical protein